MRQHKIYVFLSIFVAFAFPLLIFQDKAQALFYGGFWARVFTWHSTWCVNSLAHWLGDDEYSNETSAKVKRSLSPLLLLSLSLALSIYLSIALCQSPWR